MVSPLDFFKPGTQYADKETADERMSICNDCEFLRLVSKNCQKCGCFMVAKTKLQEATCPIGKWQGNRG